MCTCIDVMKQKLMNELPEKHENFKEIEIESVECDCEAYIFGKQSTMQQISIPFTIYHKPHKRKKKTTVNISVSYCPFCGEKYEDK